MSSKHSDVTAVLDRLKEVLSVKKDCELAKALDISPQTLSSWRQRSAVPYALCVEYAADHKISLDWLLYGNLGVPQQTQSAVNRDTHDESETGIRRKILDTLSDLPEEDLVDILSEAEHRQRLRVLEQRFKSLQAQFTDDALKVG